MDSKQAKISDQLKAFILAFPEKKSVIATSAGIEKSAMSRFMRGERMLDLSSVDKLAAYMSLELTARKGKGR